MSLIPMGGMKPSPNPYLAEHYPELGHALLVCATETKTSADIERYAGALAEVMKAARAA